MKVLVTGGAGFIGGHLVDALLEAGHSVDVVDDLSKGHEENLNPQARFFQVDIRDTESLEQVFTQGKPELVCHHAAQTDVRRSMADPLFDVDVNIRGSLNLLQLSVKHDARKFLFASTCAVYPEALYLPLDEDHLIRPISGYGVSKYSVEKYIELYSGTYGLAYTIFRYGNVYGPRQDPQGEAGVVAIFSGQMLSGVRPTIFGDGSKTRDYIFVDDVVRANLLALDDGGNGQVYNIGWGKEVTDFQVFDAVRRAVGVTVAPNYAGKRPGEMERVALDSSRAQAQLGWSPRVGLEEGMGLAVEYYRRKYTGEGINPLRPGSTKR